MLQPLICAVLWALALRWLVFRYRKLAFIPQWLRSLPDKTVNFPRLQRAATLAAELADCVYCQTVECAIAVSALCWLSDRVAVLAWIPWLLTALLAGWVAVVCDGHLEAARETTENFYAFPLVSDEEAGSDSN